MIVEDQRVAQNGLGEAVECCLRVFYTGDGMVGSRNLKWLQHLMQVLVSLFQWYVLTANAAKSCTMACQPIALSSGMYAEAKALK